MRPGTSTIEIQPITRVSLDCVFPHYSLLTHTRSAVNNAEFAGKELGPRQDFPIFVIVYKQAQLQKKRERMKKHVNIHHGAVPTVYEPGLPEVTTITYPHLKRLLRTLPTALLDLSITDDKTRCWKKITRLEERGGDNFAGNASAFESEEFKIAELQEILPSQGVTISGSREVPRGLTIPGTNTSTPLSTGSHPASRPPRTNDNPVFDVQHCCYGGGHIAMTRPPPPKESGST